MIELSYIQLIGLCLATGITAYLGGIWSGLLMFPFVLHARAVRSGGLSEDNKPFDASNRMNTFLYISHYGTHPMDLSRAQYKNGKRVFPYLTEDLSAYGFIRPDPEDM